MPRNKTPFRGLKPKGVGDKTWTAVIEAWQNGLSDREAAFRASRNADVHIRESEIKQWIKDNPDIGELRDHFHSELLSEAKLTIAKKIAEGDVRTAKWYLERKAADEFSTKAAVAFEGGAIELSLEEKERKLQELVDKFTGENDGE